MPRQQNFFYQSPLPSITQSLGKALFGDPAAHDAQLKAQSEAALREAQTGEATAHGGLYDSQSEGQRYQNSSAARQPADLEAWARSQFPSASPLATTIASTSADRLAPLPEAVAPTAPPAAPSEDPHIAGAVALSRVIASMTGAQGDKVDIPKTMSTLAAFLGGPNADTLGRGALIAGGHTPGKEFATDIPSADEIRNDEQAAGLAQAMGVARTNHASDIPVANIRARSAGNVATINNRDDIPIANIRAGAARDVAGIKVNGSAPGFDAIQRVFPNAIENSGPRTAEHNRAVGGVENSYHVPSNHPGAQAYDIPPQPGMTIQDARAKIEAANPGVRVVEALQHDAGSGLHWHFALQGSGKPGKAGAAGEAPKGISAATDRMLSSELNRQMGGTDEAPRMAADAATQAIIKNRVIQLYQQTGNPAGAVQQTLAEAHAGNLAAPGRKPGTGTAAHPAGGGGDLRTQANDAIGRGADPAAVAERYQKLTGKRFASGGNTFTMADAQYTAERHNVPIAQVLQHMKAAGQRLDGGSPRPPVTGARRSPRDGLWYVQQGKHPDGTPAYARVDG